MGQGAHMPRLALACVYHTAWPKLPHARVDYSYGPTRKCGTHSPIRCSLCVTYGLPSHHTAVSSARPYGVDSTHLESIRCENTPEPSRT
ncbi:hypothetical protein PVK06_024400 [Gossypium arboreum]|uniref:Uncharacterized protein n=1 Tax=Gossypium arboreum TaxID=29729 RepID=A0ABR0PDU8_GOSAR|nr:hypothetical protein PVK06_024400 [Gossypium arboreum]